MELDVNPSPSLLSNDVVEQDSLNLRTKDRKNGKKAPIKVTPSPKEGVKEREKGCVKPVKPRTNHCTNGQPLLFLCLYVSLPVSGRSLVMREFIQLRCLMHGSGMD